jgi:hypothetical protein
LNKDKVPVLKSELFCPEICISFGRFRVVRAVLATIPATPTTVGQVFFGHNPVSLLAFVKVNAFNQVVAKADVI